jgi:hypothetical protein
VHALFLSITSFTSAPQVAVLQQLNAGKPQALTQFAAQVICPKTGAKRYIGGLASNSLSLSAA